MKMYEIVSSKITGHKPGDIVTAEQLDGANIEALVESGHVKESQPKKVEK